MKFHSNNCIYSTCCMKILYFDIIKEDDTSVKLHEYWIYHSHKFYRYMPKKNDDPSIILIVLRYDFISYSLLRVSTPR